jgi:hypothetical protein
MPAKVIVAEVDAVILRLLHAAQVSAAAVVRAAAQVEVRAEAVREVHRARASVRGVERVIAPDRVRVATGAVIHPAKVTAAVPAVNIRRVRAAARYPSPAKAQAVLRASITTQPLLGREKKRRANRISQNTRIRKVLRECGMILIVAGRHR